ncbi:hypothetical protein JI666_17155 [Bacillus sp. NTK071]|uniref:zinc ribbon domain-containing protein n=1 Tax=Bacillus sp. NTK071 TaxID=2802175 RepID=UPI001A8C69D0|nr:hypothetical protein [Bacillus sp. NTK071]MBN8210486.1 hypothetical protein [Bacillus sp. NTK071]
MGWCEFCNREEAGDFCVKCGRKVAKTTPVRNMKWTIWLISIGALVILLAGSFYTLRMLSSPERTIDQFRVAMLEGDYEKMKNVVSKVNPLLSHEAELQGFIDLMKNHPEQRALLIQDLERQALTIKNTKFEKRDEALFIEMKLSKSGKKFLLFDHYMISPVPIYANVYTQFPGTSLEINNEEGGVFGGKEDGKKVGPFLPGLYQFASELKHESYTMKGEAEIELMTPEDMANIDLSVNGAYVSPESNYDDAVLFINGKDTGVTIGKTGEIGPFPTDGSVVLHAEKKFEAGVVKSPSVPFDGSGVYLTVDYSEPDPVVIEKEVPSEPASSDFVYSEPIIDAVNTYLRDWINAYENLDASYFTNLTPDLYSYFEDRFVSVRQNNGAFTGDVLEAAYDLDSLSISSSGKKAIVDVLVTMDSANHEPGDQNVETEVTSSAFRYQLVKSGGEWLIDSRKEIDGVDLTNSVVY